MTGDDDDLTLPDHHTTGGEPDASDSLRTFGAVVQALRENTGLSRDEFAALVQYSRHTVASIEQGRRMPDRAFVDRAESALGNTGALRKAVQHIARRPGLASWFRQWARMETSAVSLYTYECRLIPGLLQTEGYARALFERRLPPFSDEEVDEQLRARMERKQLLLARPNTAYSFILDEHLFLRRTGGEEASRELVDHVLEMGARRNVEVQVLPLKTGVHPGLNGPMQLLEAADNRWYAYCEGQETGQLIADLKVVSVLQMRYAKLRSQALTPDDSMGLLKRLRGEQ